MFNTHFIALKGNRKFKPRCFGPYKELKHIGPQAYKWAQPPSLAKLYDAFYVSLLYHYCNSWNGQIVSLTITLDGATEWEAKHSVRHRIWWGNRYFLELFVGFDISKAVWISEENLGIA